MLDHRLIRAVNSGRCLALVGSGPSTEAGYPSWGQLATDIHKVVITKGTSDPEAYKKFLAQKKYPELFKQAELDLGGKAALTSLAKGMMKRNGTGTAVIYDILARWPFACYLTTNYEDELSNRLQLQDTFYRTIRNRQEDFYNLRDNCHGLICKLHSDLDHPDEAILTSYDYNEIAHSLRYGYFRDRLKAIFAMFEVLIIGHSLSDYDLALTLETAKQTASPEHPIFMITSHMTKAEEREYLDRYNIVVTSYQNEDGTHSQLKRMLRIADKYIVPRKHRVDIPHDATAPAEAEAATSLLIYRRINKLRSEGAANPREYLGPLLMQSLMGVAPPGLEKAQLIVRKPISHITGAPSFREAVDEAINQLASEQLITIKDDLIVLSPIGAEQVAQVAELRTTEESLAFGQFKVTLRGLFHTDKKQEDDLATVLKNALAHIFRTRGLSIASFVFGTGTFDPDDYGEVFRALSNSAATITNGDLRAAFLEAAHSFIVEPNEHQRAYITSLSQGFFLYHLAGQDPLCHKVRKELFQDTGWLLDSSVLLPLLAAGSHSYPYAKDLFGRLSKLNGQVFTTEKFLNEAWEHLQYAVSFTRDNPPDSPAFLHAALLKGSSRQNLFVDGFIRSAADGKVGIFADYLNLVCPHGVTKVGFHQQVHDLGITIIDTKAMSLNTLPDYVTICDAIRKERQARSTYTRPEQVEAEFEVFALIRNIKNGSPTTQLGSPTLKRCYFVSHSQILDRLNGYAKVGIWHPEALYRYLNALPGEDPNPDLLQQCLIEEYFYAGIQFVDKARYLRFFGGTVKKATGSFPDQKLRYVEETEADAAKVSAAYERTPDLEKPFFVDQMMWRLAQAAEAKAHAQERRAELAESELVELKTKQSQEFRRKREIWEAQEEARKRNAKDPDHVKKLLRQAKKRARKKRK